MASRDDDLPVMLAKPQAPRDDDLPVLLAKPTVVAHARRTEWRCRGCNEAFDDAGRVPRILGQCGHTVCHGCVMKASRSTTEGVTARCAVCETESSHKPGERFPVDLVLLELLASLSSPSSSSSSSSGCQQLHFPKPDNLQQAAKLCTGCEAKPAEFHCATCRYLLCSDCWNVIHRLKLFQSHEKLALTSGWCARHGGGVVDRECVKEECGLRGDVMCSQCETDPSAHGHAGQQFGSRLDDIARERREAMQRAVAKVQRGMAGGYVAIHTALTALATPHPIAFLSSYRTVMGRLDSLTTDDDRLRLEIEQLKHQLEHEKQKAHRQEQQAHAESMKQHEADSRRRQVAEEEEARMAAEQEQQRRRRAEGKRVARERHQRNLHNPLYKQVFEARGELSLSGKGIKDADCEVIADALKINSTLTTLDLFYNQVGDAGCTAIGDALKINSTLTTLALSVNQVGDAGCTAIGDALKINSTLTTLNLSGNQVGDAGCTAIGNALKINSTLTTLHLSRNQVGVAGCTAIGDALKINSTLTTLYLSDNQVGDAGCTAIGDALKINSTLTTLYLSRNQVGVAGCTAIGDALKINSTLTTLYLSDNQVGDAGCTAIGDALKINSTLTTLHLSRNQVGDAAKQAIRAVWGSRKSLFV